jgi:D-amino peptidase
MRIYIAADMEGASCVVSREQCQKGAREYEEARRLLVGDVNAAVQGALDGGATEVIVADMHDGSLNLPPADLHPGARYVIGVPHSAPRFPFLDESFAGMFLVAYHARSGTLAGVLEHTMSSATWQDFIVNGRPVGEVGIDAGLAGACGVPVLLVTGDDRVSAEARKLLGDIETAVVKWGVNRHRALCLAPAKSQELIKQRARAALALAGKLKPLDFGSPVDIVLKYSRPESADGIRLEPGRVERLDGRTVLYHVDKFADFYGGTWAENQRLTRS